MKLAPEVLDGWFVVEVGIRQAWPFLTFSDPDAGDEVRLYIDAELLLEPGGRRFADGDAEPASLERLALNGCTVNAVALQDGGGLLLRFDGGARSLFVSGMTAAFTTHDVWWLVDMTGSARG